MLFSPPSLKRTLEEKEQKLSVLGECKSSHQQEASKLRATLRELERSRLQARRELQELRRQVGTDIESLRVTAALHYLRAVLMCTDNQIYCYIASCKNCHSAC